MESAPALAGLMVVEIDGGEAGAVAGMTLADHGATVYKIEPPGGAPERRRSGADAWDRGKSSVVIDPADPRAVNSLAEIIRSVDVLVHGRGSLANLIQEAEELAMGSDSRIACSISGFGERGPLAGLPARDLLVAAHLGSCADQTGWSPGPSYLVHHVASVGAGLLAVQGILAALLVRNRTGKGQHVATSLFAAALAMSGRVEGDRPFRDRGLSAQPRGTSPLYSVYACADGRWIQFGCLHGGFVERAIVVLGIGPAIAPLRPDPGFGDGVAPTTETVREPFYAAVKAAVLSRSRDDWLRAFDAADVPVAPVLDSEAFLDDEQSRVNGLLSFDDPAHGRVDALGPAVRLARTPGRVGSGPPALGEGRWRPSGSTTNAAGRRGARAETGQTIEKSSGASAPLDGLVVVEIANVIAGPMTGRYLADLGARVIKVESLDGDLFRQQDVPEFHPLNAGKQAIALDLKTNAGRNVALRLLDRADILVNNLRPGAADRLGLGDSAIRTRNPGLIYCQVSAFGSTGPYAFRPGGDPLAGAYTGMQAAQGGAGDPVYVRGAPIDYTAALVATAGVLLALVARDRDGLGQPVETSLLDAGALLNAPGLVRWPGRPQRDDLATKQHRRDALVGLYEAADGWLALAVETEQEWHALSTALEESGLDDRAAFAVADVRAVNEPKLAEEVGRRLRTKSVASWVDRFVAAGVPAAPVRAPRALTLSDSSIVDNGWVAEVVDPNLGVLRLAHGWLTFSLSTSGCRSAAPLLDGDARAILREIRRDGTAADTLRRPTTQAAEETRR